MFNSLKHYRTQSLWVVLCICIWAGSVAGSADTADAPAASEPSPIESRYLKAPPADGAAADANETPAASMGAGDMLRGVLALAAVLVLLVGSTYLMRRFVLGRRGAARFGGIEVIARSPVGPKQSVCLVKCGPRVLVVGMSPNHMAPLDRIDDPETVALITGSAAAGDADSITTSFAGLVDAQTEQYEDVPQAELDNDPAPSTDPQWAQAGAEVDSLLSKVKGLSRLCFRSPRA